MLRLLRLLVLHLCGLLGFNLAAFALAVSFERNITVLSRVFAACRRDPILFLGLFGLLKGLAGVSCVFRRRLGFLSLGLASSCICKWRRRAFENC